MKEFVPGVDKPEDRLAIAKLLDKAKFAAKTHRLTHSDFLDPHLVNLAQKVLYSAHICDYSFFGGYAQAERAVVIFRPEFTGEEEWKQYQCDILKVINIEPLCRNSLSHRDYLGALMSLGIRREVTGDIIVSEERCSIVVMSDIAEYISTNLVKVGNIGIDIKILDIRELSPREPKVTEIKATVAALRLDSFCARSFGISRSKAVEFIKAGKVQLNWEILLNPDKQIHEGDTVSLRGKGKAALEKVGGRTKKDRIAITIRKYI